MNESDCGVKVVVREKPSDNCSIINYVNNRIHIVDRPFAVDLVCNKTFTQEELYEKAIKYSINQFLNGYHSTILACGQSGTGKSYSMGLESQNFTNSLSNLGIVPRALKDIMEHVEHNNDTLISVSFIEIYNEKVYDLLSERPGEHINTKGVKFIGSTKRILKNLSEAQEMLKEGNKNRHVRPTTMNTTSSRSHGVFTIYQTSNASHSAVNMVDLAGSESVRRTGHVKGDALTEGNHINRGLLGIGNILKALSDKSKVIPYRNTVLGSVLQDSLTVNSYLTLLACISSKKEDISETLNTLRFAQSVTKLRNVPLINTTSFKNNMKHLYDSPIHRPPLASSTTLRKVNERTIALQSKKSKAILKENLLSNTTSQEDPDRRSSLSFIITSLISEPLETTNSLFSSPTFNVAVRQIKQSLKRRNLKFSSISTNDNISANTSAEMEDQNETVIANCIPANSTIGNTTETNMSKIVDITEANISNIAVDVSTTSFPNQITNGNIKSIADAKETNISKIVDITETNISNIAVDVSTTSLSNDITNPNEMLGVTEDDTKYISTSSFTFKVPENPRQSEANRPLPIITKRQSVRLIEKQRINTAKEADQRWSVLRQRKEAIKTQNETIEKSSIRPRNPKKNKKTKTITETEAFTSKAKELKKHSMFVLNLLNTGDEKAVQQLPVIGKKTAISLTTYRLINGKFKNFSSLEKAPFWRGNSYERFKRENNLM